MSGFNLRVYMNQENENLPKIMIGDEDEDEMANNEVANSIAC